MALWLTVEVALGKSFSLSVPSFFISPLQVVLDTQYVLLLLSKIYNLLH